MKLDDREERRNRSEGIYLCYLKRHVDLVRRKDWWRKRATSGSVAFQTLLRMGLDGESANGHAARIQVSAVSVAIPCSVVNLVPGDACAPVSGALRRSRTGMNRSSVPLLSIHLVFFIIAEEPR